MAKAKKKPNERQLEILKRMEAGDTLTYSRHLSFYSFRHGGFPHGGTVAALERAGWIKVPAFRIGQFHVDAILTDEGRSAIAEAQQKEK